MNTYELVVPDLALNARSVGLLELALKLNQEARELLTAEILRSVADCRHEIDYKNRLQPITQRTRLLPKPITLNGPKGSNTYVYWVWSKPIKREVFQKTRFVPMHEAVKKGPLPRYTTASLARYMIGWELPLIEQWENHFAALRVQGDMLTTSKMALEAAIKAFGNPPTFEKETGKFEGEFGKQKGRFITPDEPAGGIGPN